MAIVLVLISKRHLSSGSRIYFFTLCEYFWIHRYVKFNVAQRNKERKQIHKQESFIYCGLTG